MRLSDRKSKFFISFKTSIHKVSFNTLISIIAAGVTLKPVDRKNHAEQANNRFDRDLHTGRTNKKLN